MTDRKSARKPLPSQERLHELFRYDPETGLLIRRKSSTNSKAGKPAGTVYSTGARYIYVDGSVHLASRLIWKLLNGADPEGEIRHVNRDPSDNREINLSVGKPRDNYVKRGEIFRNPLPDFENLKALFSYEEKSGVVTRKIRAGRAVAGAVVGSKTPHGYLDVAINKKRYYLHRVIWKLMTGQDPGLEIDHINGNKLDNSWDNLRVVDTLTNSKNAKRSNNNTSGVTGVYFKKSSNKWAAKIYVNWKQIHLGYFKSFEEAVVARKAAEEFYGFHRNHDRDACATLSPAQTRTHL